MKKLFAALAILLLTGCAAIQQQHEENHAGYQLQQQFEALGYHVTLEN